MILHALAIVTGLLFFTACYIAVLAGETKRPSRWVEADNEAAARGPALSAADVLDGLPRKYLQ